MNVTCRALRLTMAHKWTIASRLGPGGSGGTVDFPVAMVELADDASGLLGRGEAAPSTRYGEDVESCLQFFAKVDPGRIDFKDLEASRDYIENLEPGHHAAKAALDIALLDGHGQWVSRPVHELFGLDFQNGVPLTSFSIGIDAPEVIREKVIEAAQYPCLKLKVGSPSDEANLLALRSAAPHARLRLDANEAWNTKEEALERLEWLARDGNIEFIEQPMPAGTPRGDWIWLRQRSPLPLVADESYRSAHDAAFCQDCFDGVNVKLVKAGGITPAFEALQAARNLGLKTMLGCMIETSVLITAAAHLAALADYLDLDGNLLITDDPFRGVACDRGKLSFPEDLPKSGLRVVPR